MWPNPQFPAALVTFTEEILNGKLHFLYSEMNKNKNHSLNTQNSKLKFNNFEHVQYIDLSCFFIEFEDCWVVLSWHLLGQSKKWKHKHVWNLFKVTNKNKTSFSYLYSELWKGFTRCSSVFIDDFEKVIKDLHKTFWSNTKKCENKNLT